MRKAPFKMLTRKADHCFYDRTSGRQVTCSFSILPSHYLLYYTHHFLGGFKNSDLLPHIADILLGMQRHYSSRTESLQTELLKW